MGALNPTLFDSARMSQAEAIELTAQSLLAHASTHRHWVFAWSGGKDSTATLTVVFFLLATGRVPWPDRITVCYADTRMEILPLAAAAAEIISKLRAMGVDVRVVMAPLDERFFVYMLGRGVPPPNNNTLRWCTSQIKVEPMQSEIQRIVGESAGDVLFLTGVRLGESAARDGRIAISCSKDGAECGQGWYQRMSGDGFATLAPLLHWRVCHVWDWLVMAERSWPTSTLAVAYGGERKARKLTASIDVWRRYAEPVWWDISQTDVLNFKIGRDTGDERHICPLQLSVIRRCIELWSQPGDTVLTPFMGIGSEAYVAVEEGRKAIGIELKESYFKLACDHLRLAESKIKTKENSLFDDADEAELIEE